MCFSHKISYWIMTSRLTWISRLWYHKITNFLVSMRVSYTLKRESYFANVKRKIVTLASISFTVLFLFNRNFSHASIFWVTFGYFLFNNFSVAWLLYTTMIVTRCGQNLPFITTTADATFLFQIICRIAC